MSIFKQPLIQNPPPNLHRDNKPADYDNDNYDDDNDDDDSDSDGGDD